MYYKKPKIWRAVFGQIYVCNHPLYDRCTLFKDGDKGLALIQQRVSKKKTYWDAIDPWLANDIYKNESFYNYFRNHAKEPDENDLYPTVFVRQVMRALGMPPLKKEFWETRF